MVTGPVLIGLIAACVVTLPATLRALLPGIDWAAPILLLGVAAAAMVIQRFVLDRRPGHRGYDGLADLFVHIHQPAAPDSAARWSLRGMISFLLTLFGGTVGPEGAAVETAQGISMRTRSRSSRWFEQRRRTDAATALAAGVAAAFQAPFAAVLLPMELGVGGRAISAALGAVVAFMASRLLGQFAWTRPAGEEFQLGGALYGFHFLGWKEWLGILAITVGAGVTGAIFVRFIRYSQESLLDLFQTEAWMRTLAGGILLFLVVLAYRPAHAPAWSLLEDVLWSRRVTGEVGLVFLTQLLGVSLVLSAFGTIGIFWPIFALGGYFGYLVDHGILEGVSGFTAVAGLTGGAAFWGAVFGAPLAGAVLAYELTGNLSVLVPCLLAAFGARWVRSLLGTPALVDRDLEARGVSLVDGRSASVLESVFVRDAMVTDYETVREQEPVSDIHARLLKSRYPFLPVVNGQGTYLGLLTVDMVQEGWQSQDPLASHSPLAKLLEAKDLLYRTGFRTPTVKANDRLAVTAGMFDEVPCVPVLGDDGRVQGLLFVYNVRLAYDREVARRSLQLQVRSN
jgi:CIC family chloride channel protein